VPPTSTQGSAPVAPPVQSTPSVSPPTQSTAAVPPPAATATPPATAPVVQPNPSEATGSTPSAPAETANPTAVAAEPQPAPPAAATGSASLPTLVAEPVGPKGSGRFSSGKAIIRHGDNLWTIAERVYGGGWHYRTIWQANDDQIRDPHWIYPGQIFDLPKTAKDP
jgi:nucleoid-associated protein YgaU